MGGPTRYRRLLLAVVLAVTGVATGVAGQAGADERIVGGSRASIADHSYMVYLATVDGFQYCGGSLVAEDKVITAAHCVAGERPADITVVAGREDKQSETGLISPVASLWVHPDFTDVRDGADVAVLTLREPLPYRPIERAGADDAALYEAGKPGLILGWGRTTAGGEPSRFLLGAEVPLVADADCANSYSTFKAESMICAGLPEGGVDSCQGDSGGPLVVEGVLVGITSWGEGCALAGKPGVYTRLMAYAAVLDEQV
ncbi:S1 family peptidase [Actinophytocola gossypii]|uniref:Serine protease n=1 Tax=Actinophytocola gossypii TaxID=2812003 RepID=A0ABT2J9Y4_9PSEU|nr:serine protease [Actinophytocola gossypii]MCT2584678.1 serine protease [Actinophytocola gossypii]